MQKTCTARRAINNLFAIGGLGDCILPHIPVRSTFQTPSVIMRTIAVLLLLVFAAAPAAAREPDSRGGTSTLSVSGRGEVSVAPDAATLVFAVETLADTAAEAAAENARLTASVRRALAQRGVADDAVGTAGYQLQPRYRYDRERQRLEGYIARNTIRLKTTELGQVGRLIDTAVQAGAGRVQSVQFTRQDTSEARRLALGGAIAAARADAEAMAAAAGGTLGELIELSTTQPPVVPFARMEAATMRAAAPETDISPGDLTVDAHVFGRWQFVPGDPAR
jgi:uncharacterized protein